MCHGRAHLTCALLAITASLPATAQNPPGLDFSKVGIYAVDYDFLDFANLKFRPTDKPEGYAKRVHECKQRGQYVMVGLYTWDRVWHKTPLDKVFADTDRILDAVNLDEVDMIFLSEEEVDWAGGFDYLNAIYDHVKERYKGPVYQWYSMPMGPRCDQKADGWILDAYGMDYDRFRKHLMKFIVINKPVVACINATPGVNSLECSQEQVRVCEEFNIPVFYYCVHGPMGSVNWYMQTDDPRITLWRSWFLQTLAKCHATDTSRLPTESAHHSFCGSFELAGDGSGAFSFEDDFSTYSFIDRATIHGFLNLAWSSIDKALWLKASDKKRDAELVYHFSTPFGFEAPSAEATGIGMLAVEMSQDGRTWTHTVATDEGATTQAGASLPDMSGQNLWVKIRLTSELVGGASSLSRAKSGGPDATTILRHLRVTGAFVPPADRAYPLVREPKGDDRPKHLGGKALLYEDDFTAQRYLHIGEITGEQDLAWRSGQLTTHGVDGRAVRVEVKQHFVSDKPLDIARVALDCMAHASLGAHNELAISRDGKTPFASVSTSGKESKKDKRFAGALELELTDRGEAKGAREFWVHLVMVNGAGKKTNNSNVLRKLTLEAQLAE